MYVTDSNYDTHGVRQIYFLKWTTSTHSEFPPKFRERVKVMWMAARRKESILRFVPRELLLEITQLAASLEEWTD